MTVVLAIGFGAFLLGTLLLVQSNLLRQLRLSGGPQRPNLVLFDIQRDQLARVEAHAGRVGAAVGRAGADRADAHRLGERPPVDADPRRHGGDRRRRPPGRVGATAASTAPPTATRWSASERLVAGEWWPTTAGSAQRRRDARTARARPPPRRSASRSSSRGELRVGVGDEIVWDVQGLPLTTRVASLREVEWARFEPNFFVVFEPGVLEDAPQTLVTLTRIERPEERGLFQRRLAERLPNVTTLDLTALQETLERLSSAWCWRSGSWRSSPWPPAPSCWSARSRPAASSGSGGRAPPHARRDPRSALPHRARRVPGARSHGRRRAVGLAGVAAWALARWVFEGPFALPVVPLATLTLGVVALTVIVGLLNSREVIRRTPLEVLRGG